MQSTVYTAAFARAVALARLASSVAGAEADSATAKLAAHVAKHKLDLAEIVARAAQPDTKADTVKAGNPRPEAVAKPDTSNAKADATAKRQAERAAAHDDRREARKLAADAVRAYYAQASLPFKAAADRFSPLRLDKAPKAATTRQAALLASMLLAGDNVKAGGVFTRGGFVIDGRNVQPETGCLSDMLGRVISYVAGPLDGANARDATFSIDLKRAADEITSHLGGALGKAALARIAQLQA